MTRNSFLSTDLDQDTVPPTALTVSHLRQYKDILKMNSLRNYVFLFHLQKYKSKKTFWELESLSWSSRNPSQWPHGIMMDPKVSDSEVTLLRTRQARTVAVEVLGSGPSSLHLQLFWAKFKANFLKYLILTKRWALVRTIPWNFLATFSWNEPETPLVCVYKDQHLDHHMFPWAFVIFQGTLAPAL